MDILISERKIALPRAYLSMCPGGGNTQKGNIFDQDEIEKRSFIQQNRGNVVYVDREKALEQGEKLNVVGGPA